MKKVPFTKYTSYGNNFVILDESREPILRESEKSSFAFQATDVCYGIGSDNFLVIQPCRTDILKEINEERHYWEGIPDVSGADFVFRMFEPNGQESFSCGNGLMCVANHIHRQYGIRSARILTELPTPSPKAVTIGSNPGNGTYWANLGHPRQVSAEIAEPSIATPYDDIIMTIKDLPIHFRRSEGLRFFTHRSVLNLTGYMVFFGEPHLVFFTENGYSPQGLARSVFVSSNECITPSGVAEKRKHTTSSLVHFIGTYFHREFAHLFPLGVNINFVRAVNKSDTLEYRCFERGINRETLACGTGALAAAFISSRLNIINSSQIEVWPHRCRWQDHEVRIQVREKEDGWLLHGNPVMLFEGVYALNGTCARSAPGTSARLDSAMQR